MAYHDWYQGPIISSTILLRLMLSLIFSLLLAAFLEGGLTLRVQLMAPVPSQGQSTLEDQPSL